MNFLLSLKALYSSFAGRLKIAASTQYNECTRQKTPQQNKTHLCCQSLSPNILVVVVVVVVVVVGGGTFVVVVVVFVVVVGGGDGVVVICSLPIHV